jgi:hypothetical protein
MALKWGLGQGPKVFYQKKEGKIMPAYTTFEQVWRKVGGDTKSTMDEILEALQEEISSRESMGSKLFHAQEFETLTSVEQERNSFVQVKYGLQDLTFLDNGNESDLWKAAQAKRPEILERDKETKARWKANTDSWSKFIDEHRPEIEDAIWKVSSQAQDGVPGRYEAVVDLGGQSLTVYKVTRREGERDVEDENFEMSSAKAKKYIDVWKERFLETAAAKETAPQREDKSRADAMTQEAQREKAEAQRASEILSGAAAIPRGLDSNLPNADLNFEQEAVMSSIDKANTEIKDMRSAATAKEASASALKSRQSHTADATALAKQKMGKEAIVTNARTGREYSGKIIGMIGSHPDTIAIQKISGNQAVLHRIKDIATESNIAVGSDLSITKGKDGKISVKTQGEIAKEKEAQKNLGEERVR